MKSQVHKAIQNRPTRITAAVLIGITAVLFVYAGDNQSHFTPLDSAALSHSELLDALFTQADGSACIQPCMFGVYPGKTAFADVPVLLRSHAYFVGHFSLDKDAFGHYDALSDGILLTFYSTQDGGVEGAYIGKGPLGLGSTPPKVMPTLGQVILSLGAPQHIEFFTGEGCVVGLHYPRRDITLFVACRLTGALTPNDHVGAISIGQGQDRGGPWRGFGSIQNYLQRKDTLVHILG